MVRKAIRDVYRFDVDDAATNRAGVLRPLAHFARVSALLNIEHNHSRFSHVPLSQPKWYYVRDY